MFRYYNSIREAFQAEFPQILYDNPGSTVVLYFDFATRTCYWDFSWCSHSISVYPIARFLAGRDDNDSNVLDDVVGDAVLEYVLADRAYRDSL